ncbi:hypothetical protein O9X81_05345 [Agrobacterium salinitolerans]|uniref:hypothetical protein n=1 Tax=Agrobacterium salinitolerans TaxID=1183413 RepID=UPI0022B8104F|nr:hypothetical protein [Agrobacterium salinitolerans]MCZ7856031.1 hypothetical protein [Agrobacterium salinitolerans]
MTWSTNITEAQTGDYVWLATKCGRVIQSYWIKKTKMDHARFAGLATNEAPIAWQPFIKPIHPFELAKQEESAT